MQAVHSSHREGGQDGRVVHLEFWCQIIFVEILAPSFAVSVICTVFFF